jgi:crossover junction endodeoxyribonuclease RuvC
VRILGLDPSLNTTGYGVVECNGSAMRLVEGGVITPARSDDLSLRLAELQRGLADVILTLRPDVMVVEEVFSQTAYPRTAIMMAHARGALVCIAAMEEVPVFNYSATAVKRALVGNGLASKQQVAAMVVQALRLRRRPSPADVTDALALAIAHARRTNGSMTGPKTVDTSSPATRSTATQRLLAAHRRRR